MHHLSKLFKVKIGFGVYDDEKNNIIAQSKIILNLHYYNDCSLEMGRINEILQFDKVVISEKPAESDWFNKSLYNEAIDFIDVINDDLSNIERLVDRIKYFLNDDNYNRFVENSKKQKQRLHNHCLLTISKICALDVDNFEFNYDLKPETIYCLHLIETPERLHVFKKQDYVPNFEIYPAIKYNPGWMGCALSYVNLIFNAKRCHLNNITIFDDDCRFPKNFEELYKNIKEFLSTIDYDMFVGCIADITEGCEVRNIYEYNGITFVEVSYVTSTCFNIYNHTSYDKILEWDLKNKNAETNTIDRFFNSRKMKFITTYPFYFDCVNVKSTLWGKNLYDYYNDMFQKSTEILRQKMEKYKNL
jgi:hypothetical protein